MRHGFGDRINIVYKLDYPESKFIEIPFKLLVLGDFTLKNGMEFDFSKTVPNSIILILLILLILLMILTTIQNHTYIVYSLEITLIISLLLLILNG